MEFKAGKKLRTLETFVTDGLLHYRAPFTGSFHCEIQKGTVFVILLAPIEGAEGFYVLPEQKEEFEQEHVPLADRSDGKYDGYSFVFLKEGLGEKYEFID